MCQSLLKCTRFSGKSGRESSQISSGRNIHWSYLFYSHGEKGSLFRADFADSWYSVARDLPWCWWWEWVSVTSASNLMSIHILSYATSTTTNDGAQLILQRIDRGEC